MNENPWEWGMFINTSNKESAEYVRNRDVIDKVLMDWKKNGNLIWMLWSAKENSMDKRSRLFSNN